MLFSPKPPAPQAYKLLLVDNLPIDLECMLLLEDLNGLLYERIISQYLLIGRRQCCRILLQDLNEALEENGAIVADRYLPGERVNGVHDLLLQFELIFEHIQIVGELRKYQVNIVLQAAGAQA